ncbi:MAG: hypothetical protein HXS54_05525 [Theionarchaea archaeon]|nr:hypothetical protein [Theionarchaea archaeon]
MMIKGKKFVILYLTDWQMRMVKDYLSSDCHYLEIPVEEISRVLYGIPPGTDPSTKKMYLTDWQIKELRDEAGISCDFIELTKDIIPRFRYGLPTE